MAAELKDNFSVDAVLFAEGKGIFDVVVDGNLLFSKYRMKRFPESGEISRLIQQR